MKICTACIDSGRESTTKVRELNTSVLLPRLLSRSSLKPYKQDITSRLPDTPDGNLHL